MLYCAFMDLMPVIFFISLIIILSGAAVKFIQNIFLTEPLISMLSGILLGPLVLNIIHSVKPSEKHHILELASEFTIAVALMATALRIPKNFFRNQFITQTNIVLFGMLLMWLSSSALLFFVLQGLSFAECLLIGAVITPTDPVIASTIVTGEKAKKFLSGSIRNTLSFEAGLNDGLAFPIVFFSVFLLQNESFPVEKWLMETVIYKNILGGIIAYVTGLAAGFLMHKANQAGTMNKKTILPFSLGLAFLLLSGLNVLEMNGIIGVFIGGLGFSRFIAKNEDVEEEKVQEAMERIFTIPVFFLFGLFIPWHEWVALGWTAVWIVALILLFRRIPAFLLLTPILPHFRKKLSSIMVMGWFGPIGVAALYYSVLAMNKTGLKESWIIASLVVFASTILHGLTSVPLEELFYKKVKKGE